MAYSLTAFAKERIAQGLPQQSVIRCDNLITIPTTLLDPEPVGHIHLDTRIRLDQALRYALDIQH